MATCVLKPPGEETMRIQSSLRAGIVISSLCVSALIAQDRPNNSGGTANGTYERQQQGNQVGNANPQNAPTSNPGFGAQTPNDVTGNSGAQQNSSYQKDRNG